MKHYLRILVILTILTLFSCTSMPPLINGYTQKTKEKNGIASLEYIELGGIKQLVLIRGDNINNPILLYLHGGPGTPCIPLSKKIRDLEKDFVVVLWDQRGTGNSYSKNMDISDYSIDKYVSDAERLLRYLVGKYQKKKAYILGQSWGTVIGTKLSQKVPELIHAFISIGQVVNWKENEQLSYKYVIDQAKADNNKQAINVLMKVKPLYTDDKNKLKYDDLILERSWLGYYGGIANKRIKNPSGMDDSDFFDQTEYSIFDLLKVKARSKKSLVNMWNELSTFDAEKEIPEIDVPVYFFVGLHDYNTPFELTYRYYDNLKAPMGKKLIKFENSGHVLIFEEYSKFKNELRNVVQETNNG